MRSFRQINQRDRVKISRLKAMGFSNSDIARKTGFNRSTISREFKRNSDEEEISHETWLELVRDYPDENIPKPPDDRARWTAESASKKRDRRVWHANQKRRRKSTRVLNWVKKKLKEGLTPEQIAGRSEIDGPEKISHECIYNYIAEDRKKGGGLFRLLTRFRKRKKRISHRSYAGQIPDRIFICKRPKVVERRTRLGDLEADLICGRRAQGYLLTVVDRVSRKVVIKRLLRKSKEETFFAICEAIKEFKLVRTMTVDNGKEFALHKQIALRNNIKVYFTNPYTSQEKGTIENTNGIIRRYFDANTNFLKVSNRKVKIIENKLNNCPRKVLKYLTPEEVHNKKLATEK